ncbi:MAG: hypothetical protein AABY22_25490, partial [Nanoarchaeota archaeon]
MIFEEFKEYNLPLIGWTKLPKPPITEEDRLKYGSNSAESNSKFLRKLTQVGFKEKLSKGQIPKENYQQYIDKCKFELDTIDELNFTDYMLLIWKIIEKAKSFGEFIDYGRGSVGSSCVSWFLGISGCDPIKYKLFFSRFSSKARAESKIVDGQIWISNSLA